MCESTPLRMPPCGCPLADAKDSARWLSAARLGLCVSAACIKLPHGYSFCAGLTRSGNPPPPDSHVRREGKSLRGSIGCRGGRPSGYIHRPLRGGKAPDVRRRCCGAHRHAACARVVVGAAVSAAVRWIDGVATSPRGSLPRQKSAGVSCVYANSSISSRAVRLVNIGH